MGQVQIGQLGGKLGNTLTTTDRNLVMRFVSDAIKRGGIRVCVAVDADGWIQIRTWDALK